MFDEPPILLPLLKRILILLNLQMMNFFFPGLLCFLNTKTRIWHFSTTHIRILVNEPSSRKHYDLDVQYPYRQSINHKFRKFDANIIFLESKGMGEIALKRQ